MARRIAIVEDDAAIRANYAEALRRHGYEVAAPLSNPGPLAAIMGGRVSAVAVRAGSPEEMRTRWPGRLVGCGVLGSLLLTLAAAPAVEARAAGQDPAPSPALEVGDVVPAFDAEALDGTTRHIEYPKGSTTVILFFLSSCPTCQRMIPEWNRAFSRKPAGLTVVGVMLDREPPVFFEAMPVSFPVVRALTRDFSRSFKISKVPVTLRVAAGGKVEGVAVGATDPIRLGELFRR